MRNALALNSNNIEVNRTKKSLLKKKKKGFTLVELIAVIAILAILAAIIVPRVASYTTSASDSRHLANARTLAGAIEAYNADNSTTPIADDTDLSTDDNQKLLVPKYLTTFPNDTNVIGVNYAAIRAYIDKHANK